MHSASNIPVCPRAPVDCDRRRSDFFNRARHNGPSKLVQFTKYSKRFVCAIAVNVENSRLWNYDKYDRSSWSSGNLLPRNEREERAFWDHVLIAEGSLHSADANGAIVEDTILIFWDDKLAN